MAIYKYVWLDGNKPQTLRSKIKIVEDSKEPPIWSFDGSSTGQAEGEFSDCILKPVRQYNNGFVFCEVLNPDGTPHATNTRRLVTSNPNIEDLWLGFEQEYVITDPLSKDNRPLGWRKERPQGMFYCGVGDANVKGRTFAEHHLHACMEVGINVTGLNAEVLIGQWEYQVFGHSLRACDDVWMSRYLLQEMAEQYNVGITFHPKPLKGDWNGSGLHANFSTNLMRTGKEELVDVCTKLKERHGETMPNYGEENRKRLIGTHETSSYDVFTYGVSDRTASVRIPVNTGYLEDRRPGANADPYLVANELLKSLY